MARACDLDYVHAGDPREARRQAEAAALEGVRRLKAALTALGIDAREVRTAGASMNRPPRVYPGSLSAADALKLAERLEKAMEQDNGR